MLSGCSDWDPIKRAWVGSLSGVSRPGNGGRKEELLQRVMVKSGRFVLWLESSVGLSF